MKDIYTILLLVLSFGSAKSQNTTYFKYFSDSEEITDEHRVSGFVEDTDGFQYIARTNAHRQIDDWVTIVMKLDKYGNMDSQVELNGLIGLFQEGLYVYEDQLLLVSQMSYDIDNAAGIKLYKLSKNLEVADSTIIVLEGVQTAQITGVKIYGDDLYFYGHIRQEDVSLEIASAYKVDLKTNVIQNSYLFDHGIQKNQCSSLVQNSNGQVYTATAFNHPLNIGMNPTSGTHISKYSSEGELVKQEYYEGSFFATTQKLAIASNDDLIYTHYNDITNSQPWGEWRKGFVHRASLDDFSDFKFATALPNDPHTARQYTAEAVLVAQNGDVIIAGNTLDRELHFLNCSSTHAFMARITAQGDPLWFRTYQLPLGENIPALYDCAITRFSSLSETINGDIVAYGTARTIPDLANTNEGDRNHGWIVRTDANGCVDGYGCERRITLSEGVDSTYHSLFSPGYQWNMNNKAFNGANSSEGVFTYRYRFSMNSYLLEGDYYYQLLRSSEKSGEENFEETDYFLKEREGKIYLLNPERDEFPFTDDRDLLLYDFTAEVGDTIVNQPVYFTGDSDSTYSYVSAIDTVTLLNGERRRRWKLSLIDNIIGSEGDTYAYVIEGMGSTSGLLYPVEQPGLLSVFVHQPLLCYSLFGETLHGGFRYTFDMTEPDSCFADETVSILTPKVDAVPIKVFPNPATGQFSIEGLHIERATLVDISGRILRTFSQQENLTVADLPAGMYVLSVISKEGIHGSCRIVVQ
ncbi:T9SS type A sorting domain-containing protein [Lewinella sp. 4G2]|uniref:T9SS type A sorting domain-containing protein n=1 Tax=Lewinella sp. 4G2 TaxID=1803372 RepID=UPI0007B49D54|nr:T9SS type A sorting domain-containing protein [Lewinella sp. 4G2]OAV43870.1 hypothetical protein A3850_004870 [Lewinella sp. 4G2]